MSVPRPPPVNPYAKKSRPVATMVVPQQERMGNQSQRRLTLQGRTYQLAANNNKKCKSGQLTLDGKEAFEPIKHCPICKAKEYGYAIPHRSHHPLCWNNQRTLGIRSKTTLEEKKAAAALKLHFSQPLKPSEKASWRHSTKEAGEKFFAKRKTKVLSSNTTKPASDLPASMDVTEDNVTAEIFCSEVTAKINNAEFVKEHGDSRAPLAMLAFASVVVKRIIRVKGKAMEHFNGTTLHVPASTNMHDNPHYHSIVGQRLLLVDWVTLYGLEIDCPGCNSGTLKNDRTNFSKNKNLFPLFGISGAPAWCMTMSMVCSRCKNRYSSNDGAVLSRIPTYASLGYPVEPKYASAKRNCHLSKDATQVFDSLMTTYGNGDLCSRLLYSACNRAYIDRVSSYYSYGIQYKGSVGQCYLEKDGQFLKAYPPLGDGIRDIYDEAARNNNNHWGISDHERHTREIQGVQCARLYAEDHTHEVTKNYFRRKILGAHALWDVATETGEIATAVLVPSTKTMHLSHAAIQLSKRQQFKPSAMYSDRWPTKIDYWENVFGTHLEGRLGLFHFTQRMIRTLRKRHIDYMPAINKLLESIYYYNEHDYEALLVALKAGTLSGTKHSDADITELKKMKYFRQRYSRFLRKEIRPPNVISNNLDAWFVRYKVNASDGALPGGGRLDPVTKDTLFTPETKTVVLNCKETCKHLQDPLPLKDMYDEIPPNPNSSHGLTEYLSRRGESNLESFHLMLAHFGNTGMREALADTLNLTGTVRYNLAIRHKLRISRIRDNNLRVRKPAAWETVVDYYNQSELAYVNSLAATMKIGVPFPDAEPLIEDTGERFFSEYLAWLSDAKPKQDANDLCLCEKCTSAGGPAMVQAPAANITVPRPTTVDGPNNVAAVDEPVLQARREETRIAIAPQYQFRMPVMLPPPFMLNPFMYQLPAWPMCCPKHQEYLNRTDKRGRPPHNKWCRHKNQTVQSSLTHT